MIQPAALSMALENPGHPMRSSTKAKVYPPSLPSTECWSNRHQTACNPPTVRNLSACNADAMRTTFGWLASPTVIFIQSMTLSPPLEIGARGKFLSEGAQGGGWAQQSRNGLPPCPACFEFTPPAPLEQANGRSHHPPTPFARDPQRQNQAPPPHV